VVTRGEELEVHAKSWRVAGYGDHVRH